MGVEGHLGLILDAGAGVQLELTCPVGLGGLLVSHIHVSVVCGWVWVTTGPQHWQGKDIQRWEGPARWGRKGRRRKRKERWGTKGSGPQRQSLLQ